MASARVWYIASVRRRSVQYKSSTGGTLILRFFISFFSFDYTKTFVRQAFHTLLSYRPIYMLCRLGLTRSGLTAFQTNIVLKNKSRARNSKLKRPTKIAFNVHLTLLRSLWKFQVVTLRTKNLTDSEKFRVFDDQKLAVFSRFSAVPSAVCNFRQFYAQIRIFTTFSTGHVGCSQNAELSSCLRVHVENKQRERRGFITFSLISSRTRIPMKLIFLVLFGWIKYYALFSRVIHIRV